MAADENLGLQFRHTPGMFGHTVRAYQGKREVGRMSWDSGHISNVYTKPAFRRQGVATALYGEAQRLHGEGLASAPKHSPNKTAEGAAWAESVGGEAAAPKDPPKRKGDRVEMDLM